MSPKVIGVIPARYASTRFPGKPLAKICGREMILRVCDGVKTAKSLNDFFVATDDQRIFELVKAAGYGAVMTPTDIPTGTDRIYCAIKDIDCDVVVNIQGDEPLIKGSVIDKLIEPFRMDPKLEMTTLANYFEGDEIKELSSLNVVKVIANLQSDAIYFSRYPIPYSRETVPMGNVICLRHVGLYGYRKSFLKAFCQQNPAEIEKAESLEQLRALFMGAKIKVVPVSERSWGVDSIEDLHKIEGFIGVGT